MNNGRNIFWVAGVCLCVSATAAFAQNASTDNAGPNRILQMLDEKERNYIVSGRKLVFFSEGREKGWFYLGRVCPIFPLSTVIRLISGDRPDF